MKMNRLQDIIKNIKTIFYYPVGGQFKKRQRFIKQRIKKMFKTIPLFFLNTLDSKRFKSANNIIRDIANDENLVIYVYTCKDLKEKHNTEITSIGFKYNGDTEFNIKTIEDFDNNEKELLEWFFGNFISKQSFLTFYKTDLYCFEHIIKRCEILGINRYFQPKNEYSLNNVFIQKYKAFYAKSKEYGKGFLWLAKKNDIPTNNFLDGSDEINQTNYDLLKKSIKTKLIIIEELLNYDYKEKLRHKSKWYEYGGWSLSSLYMFSTETLIGKIILNIIVLLMGIIIGKFIEINLFN